MGFADVNGTRLYYEVTGIGLPLVLIHGFSVDSRYWDDQMEAFARDHRVLRYDLRGFGRSEMPTIAPYAHSDNLKALLDDLGITRAHILGHSLGGFVAIDFALAFPDATSSLIVVGAGPSGFRWGEEIRRWMDSTWDAVNKGGVEAARRTWLQGTVIRTALTNPRVAERYAQLFADYSGWHWTHDDPEREIRPPAIERLHQIRVPTLILVEERTPEDYHRAADLLQRGIPHARKAILPNCGHFGSIENPEVYNEVVLRFLANL